MPMRLLESVSMARDEATAATDAHTALVVGTLAQVWKDCCVAHGHVVRR